jgi:hypothetical protein
MHRPAARMRTILIVGLVVMAAVLLPRSQATAANTYDEEFIAAFKDALEQHKESRVSG